METLKLSTIVMTITPDLYGLLTKEELEADVLIQGDIEKLKRECGDSLPLTVRSFILKFLCYNEPRKGDDDEKGRD